MLVMKPKVPKLRISYGQISKLYGYECCEGKWYWNYHKKLERRRTPVNHNFIIGGIYHEGAGMLHAGDSPDTVDKKLLKLYDKRVQQAREECDVSDKDEQDFVKNKIAVSGMVRNYHKRYKADLKLMKQVANEFTYIVPISEDVGVMIKIDNIIAYRKIWMVHEMKTVKSIDPKYVENRKYDFQTALYFHLYNSLFDKKGKPIYVGIGNMRPVKAVLYDAVQKAQFRLKKSETKKEFLNRLAEYYGGADAANKFYMEDFVPRIPKSDVLNTVNKAVATMQRIQKEDNFTKSYASCAWCDYCTLCFDGGMTKANLALYRTKREHS